MYCKGGGAAHDAEGNTEAGAGDRSGLHIRQREVEVVIYLEILRPGTVRRAHRFRRSVTCIM